MPPDPYTCTVGMTFENPAWLLLLLLALPVAWTGLRWFNTMSRVRAWSAVVLRTVLIALISGILAGASSVRESDDLAVIAVVDVSDSVKLFADIKDDAPAGAGGTGRAIPVSAALRHWFERALEGKGPDDLFGVVVFDGAAAALATPQRGVWSDLTFDQRFVEGTNIEEAMRFARALFPAGAARRLVLVSDGNETEGDAVRAAQELAASDVPVDVLPIVYRVTREVMIEAIDSPPQAASDSSVTVRVVLFSTDAASGTLDLLYEGDPIDINGDAPGTGRRIALRPGRTVETIAVPLRSGTIHRFDAVFTPDSPSMDRIVSNNRAETFTVTPGKGVVLVVDGVSAGDPRGPGRTLPTTLQRAGINAQTIRPEDLPRDLLSLEQFDLIILQNVPSEMIPRATHRVLADYVQDLGGGLVMVGGPDSFGAGGWSGTDLEPVLPVRLDLPDQLIMPSAAIMIVIDSSGSMSRPVMGGSRSQQQIANEGAALAIETLDRTDLVGVIEFNSMHRTVVPLEPNRNPRESADRVRAIAPGGGTNLYPAMRVAGMMLLNAEAGIKHMIVLTDGVSQGDPQEGYIIAQELAQRGITTTTIAVGDGAAIDTLAEIARQGNGQFYQVIDPNLLPRVFVREIRVVRKPLVRTARFDPVDLGSGSPLVSGVPRPWPPLGGLVLTRPREDPKVTYALASPEGEPLLAHWYVGRGQVAAFTSDAHDWAASWLDWPGYSALWTQIARLIAKPTAERTQELTAQIVGDELLVRLDAVDDEGRPMDLLTVPGTIYTPSGERFEVNLSQTGPGTYEARLAANQSGNYIIALAPARGQQRLAPVIGGISRPIGAEFRRLQSNVALMRHIAETTGGRLLDLSDPAAVDLFERSRVQPLRASTPLWRTLLVWSIVVFLFDVGTRRIAWDRLLTREIIEDMRERASAAVRGRSERAAAATAALRSAAHKAAPKAPEPGAPTPARRAAEPDHAAHKRAERAKREALEREARAKALRARMLEQLGGKPGASPPPADPNSKKQGPSSGRKPDDQGDASGNASGGTSGLLEAKRRARERFEQKDGESV